MVSSELILTVGAIGLAIGVYWKVFKEKDTATSSNTVRPNSTNSTADSRLSESGITTETSNSSGSQQSSSSSGSDDASPSDIASNNGSNKTTTTSNITDDNSESASTNSDVTQIYDMDREIQQGPMVWLRIEGDRIEIPAGKDIGKRLRRHLVNQGVPEQKALAVSRDHFKIRINNDRIEIQDLGSTGGTVLEGNRLTPNQWEFLTSGDEIVLAGQLRGYFEISK